MDNMDQLRERLLLAEWDLNLIEHVFISTMSKEVQAHFARFKALYLGGGSARPHAPSPIARVRHCPNPMTYCPIIVIAVR